MKEDFTEIKEEVVRELQNHNASIAKEQTLISVLESACTEMKETLLVVVKENTNMHEKMIDLESRSIEIIPVYTEYQKRKKGS